MNENAGPASAISLLIVGLFAVILHDRVPNAPGRQSSSASTAAGCRNVQVGRVVARPVGPTRVASNLAPAPASSVGPDANPSPRPIDPVAVASRRTPERPPVAKPLATAVAIVETVQAVVPPVASIPAQASTNSADPGTSAKSVGKLSSSGPKRPSNGFTEVLEGENLADVAARVYGDSAEAEKVWRANRDQLAGLDAPLDPGLLLRTP